MKEILIKIMRRLNLEWRDKVNLPFRFNRYLHRLIIAHSKNTRPSSYPYISGDSFRTIAQHVFDDFDIITLENVKFGNIIFVDIHKIQEFFNEVHPQINVRYKLITHNGDIAISYELAKFVDDKIIFWYGQNVNIAHHKIKTIPIGLENLHYYNSGIISNIRKVQKRKTLKANKIFLVFAFKLTFKKDKKHTTSLLQLKMQRKFRDGSTLGDI